MCELPEGKDVIFFIFYFFGCAGSSLWHAGSLLQRAGFSGCGMRAPERAGSVGAACGL